MRLSGPDAARIAQSLLGSSQPLEARRATVGHVFDRAPAVGRRGAAIDEVVCTWFPSPASYTGDDVVEVSGHGNPVLLARIIERAVGEGARLARPGEFTFRAFLNGRIDLVQAEAIADLIEAVTPAQAQVACEQLQGGLTREIAALERDLFGLLAQLEAAIDFPDEPDAAAWREGVGQALAGMVARVGALLRGASRGRVLREGRYVVIVGPPNSGKSTLFNALLGSERAIVTATPGTTRDLLTERSDLQGVPITLADTAGLRDADDQIEREGVTRASAAARAADLLLVAVDRSAPCPSVAAILGADASRTPRVVAATKSDLPVAWDLSALGPQERVVAVSAATGLGVEDLEAAVVDALTGGDGRDEPPRVSNVRHVSLLDRAQAAVLRAAETLRVGGGEELVAADLREALEALQEVTGERAPDAVIEEIFARFCVGK